MMAASRLRQTGRTSRMLAEARRLAKAGHAVYVVAATLQHADWLRDHPAAAGLEELGVKFESAKHLPELDWESMTLRGAHPNCRVLVDHYTIERRYGPMLDMLHRFDAS